MRRFNFKFYSTKKRIVKAQKYYLRT